MRRWLEVISPVVAVVALALGITNACRQSHHQARDDEAEVHRLIAQAEEHLQRGELEAARHDLGAARIYDRGSDELAVLDGQSLALSGDLQGGIEILRRTTLAEPDSVLAHFHLGRLLAQSGDLDGARRHLERADALAGPGTTDIGRAVILVNVGDVLLAQEDRDGAKATYQQALQADPRSPDAHARMGEIYMAEARYDDALLELGQAISADPGNVEYLLGAANAAYYADSFAQAEELARRALQLRETKEVLGILALALEGQGEDSTEARSRFEQLDWGSVRWEAAPSEPSATAGAPEAPASS